MYTILFFVLLAFASYRTTARAERTNIDISDQFKKPTNPQKDLFEQFRVPEGEDPQAYSKKMLEEIARKGQIIDVTHLDLGEEDQKETIYSIDPQQAEIRKNTFDAENQVAINNIRRAGEALLKEIRSGKKVSSGVMNTLNSVLDEAVLLAKKQQDAALEKAISSAKKYYEIALEKDADAEEAKKNAAALAEAILLAKKQHDATDINKRFIEGTFGIRNVVKNLNSPRPKEAFMVRELRSVVAQEASQSPLRWLRSGDGLLSATQYF